MEEGSVDNRRVLIERALEYIEENDIMEVFAYNTKTNSNIIQDFENFKRKDNSKIFDALQSKLEECSDSDLPLLIYKLDNNNNKE